MSVQEASLGPFLLICSALLFIIALVLALSIWRFFSGMKAYRQIVAHITSADGANDLSTLLLQSREMGRSLAAAQQQLAAHQKRLEDQEQHLSRTVQRVGLVRYNAFPDVAGDQSFSLALLDDHGDGIVITTLHGRSDARTYSKRVLHGASTYPLLPEEQQAIFAATQVRKTTADARTAEPAAEPASERAYLLGRRQEMQAYQRTQDEGTASVIPHNAAVFTAPLEEEEEMTRVIEHPAPQAPPEVVDPIGDEAASWSEADSPPPWIASEKAGLKRVQPLGSQRRDPKGDAHA